jgi:hypothetical protein
MSGAAMNRAVMNRPTKTRAAVSRATQLKRTLFASLLLIAAGPALSDSAQVRRARVFASLPDWTGIWEAEAWSDITVAGRPAGGIAAVRAKSVLSAIPPYNAEWQARYQAALKDVAALKAAATTSNVCEFGFPGVMESPAVFQIAVTPEETLLIFSTREVRHVYTDGKPLPPREDLWPSFLGHSIGHWDGQTLVIDTAERVASAPLRFSSPLVKLSDRARFTERLRLVSKDRLEDQITVEDPVALEKPWQLTLSYRRVTNLDRMIDFNCTENDRNPVVDGKITIAPTSAPASGREALY